MDRSPAKQQDMGHLELNVDGEDTEVVERPHLHSVGHIGHLHKEPSIGHIGHLHSCVFHWTLRPSTQSCGSRSAFSIMETLFCNFPRG